MAVFTNEVPPFPEDPGIYVPVVERKFLYSTQIQAQTIKTKAELEASSVNANSEDKKYDTETNNLTTWVSENGANLITSLSDDGTGHYPVLDLDINCGLVPSSGPNKWHFYIDKKMPWEDYVKLLKVMAEVGILEQGFVDASINRGYSAVRKPGVLKKDSILDIKTNLLRWRWGIAQRALYLHNRIWYHLCDIAKVLTPEQLSKLSHSTRTLIYMAQHKALVEATNKASSKSKN